MELTVIRCNDHTSALVAPYAIRSEQRMEYVIFGGRI